LFSTSFIIIAETENRRIFVGLFL